MSSVIDAQIEYHRIQQIVIMEPDHIHTESPSGWRYKEPPINPLPVSLLTMNWFELQENIYTITGFRRFDRQSSLVSYRYAFFNLCK